MFVLNFLLYLTHNCELQYLYNLTVSKNSARVTLLFSYKVAFIMHFKKKNQSNY